MGTVRVRALIRLLVKLIAGKTMNSTFLICSLLLVFAVQTNSQVLIRYNELNCNGVFNYKPFEHDADSWILSRSVDSKSIDFVSMSKKLSCSSIDQVHVFLNLSVYTSAVTVQGQRGWIGQINSVLCTNDLRKWDTISIVSPNRETDVYSVFDIDEIGAIATSRSYRVVSQDTVNGGIFKKIENIENRIELISRVSKTLLYSDTLRHGPFTNIVRTNDGRYASCYYRQSDEPFMLILGLDGSKQFVEAPPEARSNAVPTCLTKTANGDMYCFYSQKYAGGTRQPPFAIKYSPRSGHTEMVRLPDNCPNVLDATAFENVVIGSTMEGVLLIKDQSLRFLPLIDPQYSVPCRISGTAFVNSDTIVAVSQLGVFVVPLSILNPTSVFIEQIPGRVVRRGEMGLTGFLDGLEEVTWVLSDNSGKVVTHGITKVGQRDIQLPLDALAPGPYSLGLSSGNRAMIMKRFIQLP